jgi:hypothetical protein
MDQEVKYWSDYSKLNYNDRSFTLINKFQNSNRYVKRAFIESFKVFFKSFSFNRILSEAEPFDLFNYGYKIYEEEHFSDDVEDKIRHFSEECDLIQVKLFVPRDFFFAFATRWERV